MINPFLTGLTIITWFLTFTTTWQALPFAIGLSLYLVVITLFISPTIPRGQLPHLDDMWIRSFFNCLKSSKFTNPDNDIIPAIGSSASHILFSLDTAWQLETALSRSLDVSQSDPKVVEYMSQNPLERSQRTFVDETSADAQKNVADDAKEYITSHIQRLRTIPLALNPSLYLIPLFSLDFNIQTFMHFPLSAWNSIMKMIDMTIYFPAPRGAHFFFESGIIGLRQTGPNKSDLTIDIQTTISIDRNRLEKLYSEEDEDDRAEREYINQLQFEDAETQTREMEKLGKSFKQQTANRRQRGVYNRPVQLAMVARIVSTYNYADVIDLKSKWTIESQDHYPTPNKFEETLLTFRPSSDKKSAHPQLTTHVSSQDGHGYASTIGNIHPRMTTGAGSSLFGYTSSNNNQLDVNYAAHIALNTYHAVINDTLGAGLSRSALAKAFNETPKDNVDNVDENEREEEEEEEKKVITDETATTTPQQMTYPYRIALQTLETINAPATIRCYIDESVETTQSLEHRGMTHAQFKIDQQEKKAHEQKDNSVEQIPQKLSTEAFPQFTQQRTISLTIADGQDEVVWAQGVILTGMEALA